MKLQCPCGAKYSFDITPAMVNEPVRFVCPGCGLDSSAFVNEMIRQEFSSAPTEIAPPPIAVSAPAPVAAAPSRLSINRPAAHGSAAAPATTDAAQVCSKHNKPAVERCRVCQKPLCPACMEMFGYVCSPLCQAKASSHGINVPQFAGQKNVVERKRWRKIALIGGGVVGAVVALLGLWFWYAWFGSVPHPIFSVRFDDKSYAGSSVLCGEKDFVFLHGGTLARYPVNSKQPVWSIELIDKKDLAAKAQKVVDDADKERTRWYQSGERHNPPRVPSLEDVQKEVKISAESSLHLIVHEQNIWVQKENWELENEMQPTVKLTQYDWNTGKPGKEIIVPQRFGRSLARHDELLFMDENLSGQHVVTHVNLASGASTKEEIGDPVGPVMVDSKTPVVTKKPVAVASARSSKKTTGGGLPAAPGAGDGKPLDPAKVAEQAQRLSLPAKTALPAVLANAQHQEQIFKELKSGDAPEAKLALLAQLAGGSEFESRSRFAFVPSQYGYLEWTEDLIEKKFSEHKAMKDPPKKSALANSPSMANTGEIANEILNDMQRSYGGATELEDESRYLVTVRTPGKKDGAEWKGEVLGPPSLIPQKTVTVVAGGKMFVVLDKSNKKLWQASLTYKIRGGSFYNQAEDEAETSSGEGPCVERGDSLYVFDEATLTAFDLASGNVRWRVPSIGIVGLFFDEKGMLYVNSTTASLDSLKYSRQIDVNATKQAAVLKIDPKSGKVLWSVQPGGFISRVEGKYILCVAKNDAGDGDQENPYGLPGQMSSLLAIRRLNPKNGKILWDHAQQRCPLDIRFKGNTIELVFKKEVQVLKFLSF